MSENLLQNIAESVGMVAKQGASNALKDLSNNDLVGTAIMGAQNSISQLTPINYTTQKAPVNFTSSSAPSRVTFGGSGNPIMGRATIAESANMVSAPRDSNGRFYLLNTPSSTGKFDPPGGRDDPNLIDLQLAEQAQTQAQAQSLDFLQEAILYGPEALRQRPVVPSTVKFPINSGIIAKGTDDGMKPQATPAPIIYGARVEREDSGGWPAGFRIEDRSKYGPQGDMARDTIPASVVTTFAGGNLTGGAKWFFHIALALMLLLLILYIVKRVLDESKRKKNLKEKQVVQVDEPVRNK